MRKPSLSLAAATAALLASSAAAVGIPAPVVKAHFPRPEGYDGTRQSRRAMERAAAKRAKRAARNLRNAGGRS